MTVRTIAPHRHAIADVHDIICYYREQAGTAVAENFAIEIDEAYARLRQHPKFWVSASSTRFRHRGYQILGVETFSTSDLLRDPR